MLHIPARKFILITIALVITAGNLFALDRAGRLSGEERWTLAQSPVKITNKLSIESNGVLTIDPGVVVQLNPQASIIVQGRLIARGTPTDSIRFTGTKQPAKAGDWGGIVFRESITADPAYNADFSYADRGSILEYCIIEYAGNPTVELGSAIEITATSPLIANSTIRDNKGKSGTIRINSLCQPCIRDCWIASNQADRGGAISINVGAKPVIQGNMFAFNSATDIGGAIYISLSTAEIVRNTFVGNKSVNHGGAIYLAKSNDINIRDNAFLTNRSQASSHMIYINGHVTADFSHNLFDSVSTVFYLQGAEQPVQADNNWWGKPYGMNFKDVIRDRHKDRAEPLVNYEPPLWAPSVTVHSNPRSVDTVYVCLNDRYDEPIRHGTTPGAKLRLRLNAPDLNPFSRDVIPVRIASKDDPTGIVVPLFETEINSGIFQGRSDVRTRTNQEFYLIGDNVGGNITITPEFFPSKAITYQTLPPNPIVEQFVITEETFDHLISHNPKFVWEGYDILEKPQKAFKIDLYSLANITANERGTKIWDSGEKWIGATQFTFPDPALLVDAASYMAVLTIGNGDVWSLEKEFPFRMNSLPSIPEIAAPLDKENVTSAKPALTVRGSVDKESDSIFYLYEIYPAEGANPVQTSPRFYSGSTDVTWNPAEPLVENSFYRYRARPSDPWETSGWTEWRFFQINVVEEAPAPFVLLTPITRDTVVVLHPSLYWGEAFDPDPLSSVKYRLELFKGGVKGSPTHSYDNIVATSFTLPDSLDNETLYSWRVIAIDNTNRQTVSSTTNDFTIYTTPTIPVLASPLKGEERKPQDAITWFASTDPNPADKLVYEIELSDNKDFTTRIAFKTVWERTTINVEELEGWDKLVDNKVYHWRVRARDNHNAFSKYSQAGSFFYNRYNDPPAPVAVISAPTDKVTGNNRVTFVWVGVNDPDLSDPTATISYEIQAHVPQVTVTKGVSDPANSHTKLGDFDGGTGTIQTFRTQPGQTTYTVALEDNRLWSYRIRSIDDGDSVSAWSAPRTVLVNSAEDRPAPFALKAPANNAAIAELDSITFEWEFTTDPDWLSSVRYKLELTPNDPKGKPFTIETEKNSVTYKGGLLNDSGYKWKVTALDNTGLTTVCTVPFAFTVSTTPTVPRMVSVPMEIRLEGSLGFYTSTDPNPADRLTYSLQIAAINTFATTLVSLDNISLDGNEANLPIQKMAGQDKLQDNKDYYVRVKATDNHKYSSKWSQPEKFRFNRVNDAPTVPVAPFAPADSAVVKSTTLELAWGSASDADLSDPINTLVYEIRMDSDGELEKTVARSYETRPGVTKFSIPEPLDDNKLWVWQVRARDDEGATSPWSARRRIMVNVREDAPTAITPLSPANGEQLNYLGPITIKWNESEDPDYKSSVIYRLEYGTNSGLIAAKKVEGLTKPSFTTEGKLENTTYYWRVTSIDNTRLEAKSPIYSFVLDTRPSQPAISSPIGGVELLPAGKLEWSASSDPNPADRVTYELQVASNSNFNLIIVTQKGITSTSIAVNSLTNFAKLTDNSTYAFRVKAVDNHGVETGWSNVGEFFLNLRNDPPTAVTEPMSPENGAEISSVRLSWGGATDPDINDTPGTIYYKIELAPNPNFTKDVVRQQTAPGVTNHSPTGLADNSQWFWRVRAVDKSKAEGVWSPVRKFILNSKNEPPANFNLLSPANNSQVNANTRIIFKWNPSKDPDFGSKVKYKLEMTSAGAEPFTLETETTTANYTGQLVPGTTYSWKVTAIDNTNLKTESAPFSFTVKGTPPATQP